MYNVGTFNMSGGTITGNNAAQTGGGVYSDGTFTISGSATITGNVKGGTYDAESGTYVKGDNGTDNNVYLPDGKVITVAGALTGSEKSIGVTMQTPGVFTSSTDPIKASEYKDKFSSDDTTCSIKVADNELRVAQPEITYIDPTKTPQEQTIDDYTVVTTSTTKFEDGKWYVVNNDVTNENRIAVNGTANLILMDGKTLTASKGINVAKGQTLNIYGQTKGIGTLIANGVNADAGIGTSEANDSGNVNIYGGTVNATGGSTGGAGIGGGKKGFGGNVTINGGNVIATGGEGAMGIGAGSGERTNGTLTLMGVGMFVSTNNSNWSPYDGSTRTRYMMTHTHSFMYSASGATITASCANTDGNCPLDDGTEEHNHTATLTIVKPTLTTYGQTGEGISAEATITDANSIQGDAKVSYFKATKSEETYTKTGTVLEAAPADAGDYVAEITLGTEDSNKATASVGYTIAKADPTATAPSPTATYGQILKDVTLTNPTGNTAGTWAWKDAATTSVGNAGSNQFKADFTPTDTANYNSRSNVDVTVTVGKAKNPATITGTASVMQGGSTADLAKNVKLNGAAGAVTYAISGDAKGCSLNGSVLTSGNSTGTVTVNVSVAADNNYEALASAPITVTITEKGKQTITASDVTATYGDTDKKVSAKTSGDGAISYAVKEGSKDYIKVNASTGALTIKKVPADGKAKVVVTAAGTARYKAATKEVTVKISKAKLNVTAKNNTISYGSKPEGNGVKYEGLVNGDKASSLGGKLKYSFNYKKNGKPGTYQITPSGLTSANYKISYDPGKLTVKDKTTVLAAKAIAKGERSIKYSWNKITGAASYEIWSGTCGTAGNIKKVKTLSGSQTSYTQTGLGKNSSYKFYVVAKDSKGNVLSKSKTGHMVTGNVRGKHTNAKSLKVSKPKVTLSKGGTRKIDATQTKEVKGKELLTHKVALLRYKSEKPSVATVDENGTIKAVGTGWCRIYVQTVNGIWQTVEVTVK